MSISWRPRSTLISLAAAVSIIAGCSSEPPAPDTTDGEDEDRRDAASEPEDPTPTDESGDKRDAGKAVPKLDASQDARVVDAGGEVKNDAGATATDSSTADAAQPVADAGGDDGFAGCKVSPITEEMRSGYAEMKNAYYKKYASANGVVVATGAGVDDEAIIRYCRLLVEMFSNADVHKSILSEKMWFTMISEDEQLSSLPQISKTYGTSLNARARGLGGLTPTICAEDSIMCMPGDLWKGDCICPHETGHTMYSSGIAKVPALSSRLTAITKSTRSSGRIANSYVWQDGNESGMMAWGVQVWYDCAINGTKNAYHPDINTRAELQKELPEFYEFLADLLPADRKYEDCYSNP